MANIDVESDRFEVVDHNCQQFTVKDTETGRIGCGNSVKRAVSDLERQLERQQDRNPEEYQLKDDCPQCQRDTELFL